MNNPVKVQPLYNPSQGKPPNAEGFSSTKNIVHLADITSNEDDSNKLT